MRYIVEKNYTEFMNEIAKDLLIESYPLENYSDNVLEEKIKNTKNALKKILKALGMEKILQDKRYINGREKIFPVHFQILCKVLLEKNRSKKDDFVNKIMNKNYKKITDEEIDEFLEEIDGEFSNWFKQLEFEPKNENERSKKELDDIFNDIEEEMIDSESTEWIDTLDNDDDYSKREVEYLQMKFSLRQQKNTVIECVENNLRYALIIDTTLSKIHFEIDEMVNEMLDLKAITEQLVLLEDYESELLGRVAIPKIIIENNHQRYQLSNKRKSIILKELYCDIEKCLDFYKECIQRYVEEKNKDCLNGDEDCRTDFLDLREDLMSDKIDFLYSEEELMADEIDEDNQIDE